MPVCLMIYGLLWASSLVAGVPSLDMESWLEIALPQHPALRESEAEVQARQLRAEERLVWEDPELRIGADERPGLRDEQFVALRLRIPHYWEEDALGERELSRLDLARAEQEAATRMAREDLGRLYLEAVATEQLVGLAGERVAQMRKEVNRALQLLERRRFNRDDLLEMQIDLADAVADLSGLEEAQVTAHTRIHEYLPDMPSSTTLSLEPVVLEFDGEPPGVEQVRQRVMRADPELAARVAAIRAANAAVAAERAKRIPFPTFIQGTWTHDRNRDQDEWEARMGISVPLFSWTRGTDPRERAELIIAQADAEVRREEIARLSTRLCSEYMSRKRQLETLQASHQPVVRELDSILQEYQRESRPGRRLEMIDDRFRLQRDVIRARLDRDLSAWALHAFLMHWE